MPVQRVAKKTYRLFLKDTSHPSSRVHALGDRHNANLKPGSFSVSVSSSYRAIYFVDGDTNVWYWVGSHSDYNTFVGKD